MKSKGQSAIEFFILIGFAMFIFVSFLILLQGNINNKNFEKIDSGVREVALTVQDEIALAYSASNGYSRNFTLPNDILSKTYTLQINLNSIYVITDDQRHAISLNVFNVTGQPLKGNNFIRKSSGIVYLN